jgi:hypothetical protein
MDAAILGEKGSVGFRRPCQRGTEAESRPALIAAPDY